MSKNITSFRQPYYFSVAYCKKFTINFFIALFIVFFVTFGSALAIDISDRPLDVEFHAASTTVMFLLDDSGSMDWEMMTLDSDGIYGNGYIFGSNGGSSRPFWRLQWSGNNRIYYNPLITYRPWPSHEEDKAGEDFDSADIQNPRSNPMQSSTYKLSSLFYYLLPDCSVNQDCFEDEMNQYEQSRKWIRFADSHEFNFTSGQALELIIERHSGSTGSYTYASPVKFVDKNGVETIINPNSENYEDEGWSNSGSQPGAKYTSQSAKAIYEFKASVAGEYKIYIYGVNGENYYDRYAKVTVIPKANSINIKNSHYFLVNDKNDNGVGDSDEEVYLVNIDGHDLSDIKRTFYKMNNTGASVKYADFSKINITDIPLSIRPMENTKADLQNFANWFSFYRKRGLAAKACVGRTIADLEGLSVGLYSLQKRTKQEALPVKITHEDGTVEDDSPALLEKLYNGTDSGGTPLIEGLRDLGEYYMGNMAAIGLSPYANADNGGGCQQVYAIAMTDGYWGSKLSNFGDKDSDGNSGTLSDVAYKYYHEDLRPDLIDAVPTNNCDTNTKQHMVTYAVSFGVHGSLDPDNYDRCTLKDSAGNTPVWPRITQEKHKIDDLFHAAANSTGEFFSASNPEELVQSLTNIFSGIAAREINGSSIAVASEQIFSSSFLFQGSYLSSNWSGELEAYKIMYDEKEENITREVEPKWRASEMLADKTASERKIITYNPLTKDGSIFRWNSLTTTQKNLLLGRSADDTSTLTVSQEETGGDIVNYLRGQDNPKFRTRGALKKDSTKINKLGDIVHSSPVLVNDYLYVGANDGMLHVFDPNTGSEVFAYIPNLVFENLDELLKRDYTHKFYVDQTPVYARIPGTSSSDVITYVIGGLGKGGRGYYCLNVTDMAGGNIISENSAKSFVAWEFTDSEMGYSFSKPVAIKTKSTEHPYVVIFGNGYNSSTEEGIFYILDLISGDVINKYHTKVFENGLSSPIATDVNNDYIADYVYVGDLKGNLWKFDITGTESDQWGFAFGTANMPEPLFTTSDNQPITSKPDVGLHCALHGYLVAFGTGKYLGMDDLGATDKQQAMYCVWDYGDDLDNGESLGAFVGDVTESAKVTRHPDNIPEDIEVRMLYHAPGVAEDRNNDGGLEKTTGKEQIIWKVIEDKEDPNLNQIRNEREKSNPKKDIGWFLPMSTNKERIVQDPVIRGGALIFLSKVPVQGVCTGGGYSMVYSLNLCTGKQLCDAWTTLDRIELNPPVFVKTPDGDKMIFGKDKAKPGPEPNIDTDSPGEDDDPGIFFWQEIIGEETEEQ